MFTIIDRYKQKSADLGNDFPKFDQLKNVMAWECYVNLIKNKTNDFFILEYKLGPAEVNWATRQPTEFHKITKDSHVKIGFFDLTSYINLTKDLCLYDFGMLSRRRYVVTGDCETVYVLE